MAVRESLAQMGHEVLAIDGRADLVAPPHIGLVAATTLSNISPTVSTRGGRGSVGPL